MVRLRFRRVPSRPPHEEAWDRAIARLDRSVRGYHDKARTIADRQLRTELELLGDTLEDCRADLDRARVAGVRTGQEALVVRATHRAATLTAHATEATLMARDRSRRREPEDVVRCVDTTRTLVKAVRELADACLGAAGLT